MGILRTADQPPVKNRTTIPPPFNPEKELLRACVVLLFLAFLVWL
ncbi:MAG: hypothetical protein ACP5E2_17100 [Terracidiphilus sp.]